MSASTTLTGVTLLHLHIRDACFMEEGQLRRHKDFDQCNELTILELHQSLSSNQSWAAQNKHPTSSIAVKIIKKYIAFIRDLYVKTKPSL